ncbi:uncharacterized protein LOC118402094 isoform X3 [Oncorhynchus keta]|nr:uncharacterized protein LOC118402094 isoform X3 [Oncorhynchus keta]
MTSARIKPIITCPDLSSGSEVPPESSERNTPLELDSAEQPSHQNLFTRIEDEEDDEIQFRREVYSLDIPDYLVPGAPEHNNTEATGKKRKNNNTKKTEKCGVMPAEIAVEPELAKYWAQRYRLFSWFDEGIKLEQVSQVLFRVHLPTCQFLLPGSCARFGSSLHWFAGTFQYNSPILTVLTRACFSDSVPACPTIQPPLTSSPPATLYLLDAELVLTFCLSTTILLPTPFWINKHLSVHPTASCVCIWVSPCALIEK